MKRQNELDYRGYKYRDKVPLLTIYEQMKSYFDKQFGDINIDIDIDDIKQTVQGAIEEENIQGTIVTTLNEGLDDKLCKVHKHIDCAEKHLCCDVNRAKQEIIEHIDNSFENVDFDEKFDNLNEQVASILNRL